MPMIYFASSVSVAHYTTSSLPHTARLTAWSTSPIHRTYMSSVSQRNYTKKGCQEDTKRLRLWRKELIQLEVRTIRNVLGSMNSCAELIGRSRRRTLAQFSASQFLSTVPIRFFLHPAHILQRRRGVSLFQDSHTFFVIVLDSEVGNAIAYTRHVQTKTPQTSRPPFSSIILSSISVWSNELPVVTTPSLNPSSLSISGVG